MSRYKIIFNQIVLEAVKRWLKKSDAHSHIHSPLDILDTLLKKSDNSTFMDGGSLVVHYFAVDSYKTQELREHALILISDCLTSNQPKTVLRALKSLAKALKEPVDRLSCERIDEQCEKWVPEQLKILELINTLINHNKQALIYLKVINILKWHVHLGYSVQVRRVALQIIKLIPDTFEFRLIGILAYISELDWLINNKGKMDLLLFQTNWQEREKRVNELAINVVKDFLKKYPDAKSGIQVLNKHLKIIQDSGLKNRSGSLFVDALLKIAEVDYIAEMCKAIIDAPDSLLATNLASLLYKLRKLDVHRAIKITQLATHTNNSILCSSIAKKFWAWDSNLESVDVDIINKLLTHDDMEVKKHAIDSLLMMKDSYAKLVISMAIKVDIGANRELAIELCKIFSSNSGISPDNLTDEELEILLAKLERVTDISNYQISIFIAYCSKRLPRSVVQLLLKRIHYDEIHNDINYHPLPYTEFQQRFDGLAENDEYEDILRDILKHVLDLSNRGFLIPELFKEISLNFSHKSLKVLNEWINSQVPEQLLTVSYLLRNLSKSFVLDNVEFISNLLEKAYDLGDNYYKTVCNDLSESFSRSEYFGILGATLPQNEETNLSNTVANIAKQFILGTPSQEFYNSLYNKIIESNKSWIKILEEINE